MKALYDLRANDFIEMAKLIDNNFIGNVRVIVSPLKDGTVKVTGHSEGGQCINCEVLFDIKNQKLNGVYNQNTDEHKEGAFYHVYPPTLKRVIDYLKANDFDYCPNTNISGTVLKTLVLILLPFFAISQDTLKAELKIKQGNWTKYVIGYVVLKDCVVIEYLRVNTWRKREKLLPFKKKHKVVDYWLVN